MITALLLRLGISRWVVIAALCAAAAGGALWYRAHLVHLGVAQESTRRDAIDRQRDAQAKAELAVLNARIAAQQAELDQAIAHVNQLKSDLDHEQANSTALQADLAAGRRRMSVAITGTCHPAQAEQGASPATADVDPGAKATADLDPEAAAGLTRLVGEGDSAIIRLNACIQAYDAVKAASE